MQIAEELNRRYPKENGTWYVSAVRRILMNEKYIGDVHHQKNFTPDDLPLLCQKNSGQLPQYYVQNHHEALVSRQEFEKVQTLLKRKGTERKHQNTCAFSNKLYCAECGSVFSRKVRANGVVVWGCRKHLDKSKLCPVKPVYEADLCRAFLSMYNKLQANSEKILRPAMDGTKFCGSSPSIPEEKLHRAILKAVQDLAANFTDEVAAQINGILHSIQTGESIKPNLQEQLEQTQQEFDRLLEMSLDFDEDTPFLDNRLKKLNNKIKSLKKAIEDSAARQEKARQPEMLLSAKDLQILEYDDALTARIIEKITVRSRSEIEIRFIGGYKKTMQLT